MYANVYIDIHSMRDLCAYTHIHRLLFPTAAPWSQEDSDSEAIWCGPSVAPGP